MEQWRWQHATTAGQRWLAARMDMETKRMNPDTVEMTRMLYAVETDKVRTADPIYVSADMCELVAAAKSSFAPEPLLGTDLMTDNGFVYFAEPFPVLDRFDDPVNIAAFSWVPMFTRTDVEAVDGEYDRVLDNWRRGEGRIGQGVALTLYAATDADVGGFPEWADHWGVRPTVVPIHITPWFFGMAFDGNQWDEIGRPTGAEWWWRIVQTSLRLMQQRVAVRHTTPPDRGDRRAAARINFPHRETLVVRLRRERSDTIESSGHTVEWTHRWIVGGHWRNQWFPSAGVHRQIWISPYVKGPDDQPLVVKPRAYTWDR